MRATKPLLCSLLVVSCQDQAKTDRDDITTEWSKNGDTLVIKRKGATVLELTNGTNAFHVTSFGTDGIEDFASSYFEDAKGDAPAPESSSRALLREDGSLELISYDASGKITDQSRIEPPLGDKEAEGVEGN